MKEYRIAGKYGQWGEALWAYDDAEKDLIFAAKHHPTDTFHIEERDVSEWRRVYASEEDAGAEDGEDQREEEAPQADEAE